MAMPFSTEVSCLDNDQLFINIGEPRNFYGRTEGKFVKDVTNDEYASQKHILHL